MFRLIIADDHPAVLQAVKQLLQEEFPSSHIGEATDTKTLLDMALNQPWDLVITDLAMPDEGGFAALKKIKQAKKKFTGYYLKHLPGRTIPRESTPGRR